MRFLNVHLKVFLLSAEEIAFHLIAVKQSGAGIILERRTRMRATQLHVRLPQIHHL